MRPLSRGCLSKRISLFVLWSAVLAFFAASAHAQSSFNYVDFSSINGLALNGTAAPAVNTNKVTVLRLTPATGGVGSVWYTNPGGGELPTPLPLVNGFTTTFAFQITVPQDAGLGPADGLAFVVQGDPAGASALGLGGGSIGFAGIAKSVAVEFDTWCNGSPNGDTCNGRPNPFSSSDELSVNSCGANANTTNHTAGCTFGTVDLSALSNPIYLADGKQHVAQVSYSPPASTDGTCTPVSALGSIGCGSIVVILDGQTVLTVPFGLAYLGLDQSADAYAGFTGATGGGLEIHDIVNWSFMADVSSAITQPINTNSPPDLPAVFNSNTGNVVSTDTDFSTSGGLTSPLSNPIFLSINNALSQTNTWPQYVVGTPWATSLCTIKAGNGGTDLCSLYVNACYDQSAGPSTADDFNCPQVANTDDPSHFITLKDTFDWGNGGKQPVTPGTTVSLVKFSPSAAGEKWQPSAPPATSNPVCTQIAPVGNALTQCDLSDTAVDVYGDQTTTRGTSPRTKGWLISVLGVPMPLTHLNLTSPGGNVTCPAALNNAPTNDPAYAANIWSNGACVLDVKVSPATPPGLICSFGSPSDPCNNFQAAPILSWLYGTGIPVPAVQPGPIPGGDTQLKNQDPDCGSPSPCSPPSWDVLNTPLSAFFGGSGDGQFVLHWSAKDAAGITEKNVKLVDSSGLPGGVCPIPGGSEAGAQCYVTSYFTTMVNLDSTNPTVSSFAFSPPGGTYTFGQNVVANFTCADPLTNNVASGVASCTAVTDSSNAPFATGGSVSTTTTGPHTVTVTAVDNAGNKFSQVYNYTVTANSADVAVFEQETSDYVKHGTSLTYINWGLDLSKATAQGVTITFQMPSSVLGGAITAKMAIVSCSLLGCSSMPTTGGSDCTISGGGGTVTCSIGTLPSVYNLKGAVMKLTIPVASGVLPGTVFKINSSVTSANDPNPKNNAISDTITVK